MPHIGQRLSDRYAPFRQLSEDRDKKSTSRDPVNCQHSAEHLGLQSGRLGGRSTSRLNGVDSIPAWLRLAGADIRTGRVVGAGRLGRAAWAFAHRAGLDSVRLPA